MMMDTDTKKQLDFESAYERLKGVVKHTPLEYNAGLSAKYDCELYLKRNRLLWVKSQREGGAGEAVAAPGDVGRIDGHRCCSR